ncbi:L-glutaminase [Thalassoporum mexicanum PCC 7367]|uniref:glutaminase n=1 Tax=Thalassoporum mexicanum TaxID=3457544 RepID=UPI00029FC670|nr:glutaminase [Pseudanabaena sp. PCC 7367]AFY69293.1 L-glutaminase [Pseudanabaena sp. PCC 7367]
MTSANIFNSVTPSQLDVWIEQAIELSKQGTLPQYIPQLALAQPECLAIALSNISNINGSTTTRGAIEQVFPLMSVIKPLVLLFLLETVGAALVFNQVGMEASAKPFNDLPNLAVQKPPNPMVNSGAIALAGMLPGENSAVCYQNLCNWLNQVAGTKLFLDQAMLASVRSRPNQRNRLIADQLEQYGDLESASKALDTYNQVCCLAGTVQDVARLGLVLAGANAAIDRQNSQTVTAIMTTCGMYEASGSFAVQVGLPSKSGVSGVLLAVIPQQGAIACYSPPLDKIGNSIAGVFLVQQISQALQLSIFG